MTAQNVDHMSCRSSDKTFDDKQPIQSIQIIERNAPADVVENYCHASFILYSKLIFLIFLFKENVVKFEEFYGLTTCCLTFERKWNNFGICVINNNFFFA